MIRMIWGCVKCVAIWYHFSFKRNQNLTKNQCRYETEVRLRFDVHVCWFSLRPIWEPRWRQLWICDASTANFNENLESYNQLNLKSKENRSLAFVLSKYQVSKGILLEAHTVLLVCFRTASWHSGKWLLQSIYKSLPFCGLSISIQRRW